MTKNQILERIYLDDFYKTYINALVKHNKEEAHSEFIALMCEVSEEKLKKLHQFNELKYYSIRVIYNMIGNKASNFNKIFNFRYEDIETCYGLEANTTPYNDEKRLHDEIHTFIKKRSKNVQGAWADEILFNEYIVKGKTYRQMQEETGIHYVTLFKHVHLIKEMLHTKFKNDYDNI